MISIQGKGVSSGVGAGPLYFYQRAQTEIPRYTVEDTDAEWHRFKGAQTGAVEQLGDLAEKARAEAGDEAAMLFETHQMMAEDLDYEEAIEQRITEEKMNAEAAIADTAEQFAAMFEAMDDSYMQARAADVKDVSRRLLDILSGAVAGGIASDVPVILAADDLAPSETVQLDKSKILGFITAGGSGSSHTAILARTMGIPAIVGVGGALKAEYAGRPVIIDGATGNVVIDPDDMTRDRLMKKREEQLRLQRLLETLKGQPNVTKDGKSIRVYCNIGRFEVVVEGHQVVGQLLGAQGPVEAGDLHGAEVIARLLHQPPLHPPVGAHKQDLHIRYPPLHQPRQGQGRVHMARGAPAGEDHTHLASSSRPAAVSPAAGRLSFWTAQAPEKFPPPSRATSMALVKFLLPGHAPRKHTSRLPSARAKQARPGSYHPKRGPIPLSAPASAGTR